MTRWIWINRFRSSLAFKVIFSTVLLSLGVVWLTGSTLYAQLSDRIQKVKLDSSLAEARSAVFNAQYRFVVAQNAKESVIKQIVEDVVVNSSTIIGTSVNGHEVALLLTRPSSKGSINYERTSNLISASSIPTALRSQVQKSTTAQWSKTTIRYANGNRVPGLAIGQKVSIPKIGAYEMYLIFSLEDQNDTLELLSRSLLLTGLTLLILIGLITWLVIRQVVRPVREAARIAEEFTAGNLNLRMQVESNDELARLGIAFNEMASSLQNQISRLENLSRVQQRFVSDVSHELRTPLTTLRMAAEVIHSARKDFDPNISRSAELLVAQLDRFERLLEDLLEVSRFDAEVAVLESVQFDMTQLVIRCISDLSLLASEYGISIEIHHPDQPVLVNADTRRVERIMRNLITNAIEHADGEPVKVTIVETGNTLAVGVRDYGVGLDGPSAYRVFDRFWRADPSRARVRGGTGLGLSIALEDARLHNGELEAWGRPGAGAHFVLTLPKRAGDAIEARLIRLQPEDYLSTPE
ncbi:MAG: MtrAB system histidine kinase MtrB [Actinomycetota bacterium]